jgi:hypothetical protein
MEKRRKLESTKITQSAPQHLHMTKVALHETQHILEVVRGTVFNPFLDDFCTFARDKKSLDVRSSGTIA